LQKSQLTPERIEKITKLNDIAAQRGQTLAQMALAWCLHKPQVTSVIVGTSSVKQLQDNIDSLKNTTFTDDELWRIGELG
jgi:L-glyceraldehyde 3-phosphate reductase